MLRVSVKAGRHLIASDYSLFGNATSDPYVKIKIGARDHTTKVISKNLNPNWENEDADFFLYNRNQECIIQVFDKDYGTGDDLIGIAECTLQHLLNECGKSADSTAWIALTDKKGTPAGELKLAVELEDLIEAHHSGRQSVAGYNLFKTPKRPSPENLPKRTTALLGIMLNSARGIPKGFSPEGCTVTFELSEEGNGAEKRSIAGYPKFVDPLVEHEVPLAQQILLENLHVEAGFSYRQLADLAGLE